MNSDLFHRVPRVHVRKPETDDDCAASDPRNAGATEQAGSGSGNQSRFLSGAGTSDVAGRCPSLGPTGADAVLPIAEGGAEPHNSEHVGNLDALRVPSAVNESDSAAVLAPPRSKDGRPCTLPLRPTAKDAEARTEAITRPMEARQ